jgi:hypothetical protein
MRSNLPEALAASFPYEGGFLSMSIACFITADNGTLILEDVGHHVGRPMGSSWTFLLCPGMLGTGESVR